MYHTRTVYYVLHCTPDQPYPLYSGAPFTSLERARQEACKLARHGYGGWMMRVRETQQAHVPDDHWLIDHRASEAIGWIEQFSSWESLYDPRLLNDTSHGIMGENVV